MRWYSLRWPMTGSMARASCSWCFARSGRLRRRAFSVHWLCCSGVTRSSCPTSHGVRQSQDAMGQHGAHLREVERPLALAVGELDLALRQVRARLHGQARKPGRGRGEDPSHQLVSSIKERIVNGFPIFLGGSDRMVEFHQLALELKEGGIIAGRIVFRHRVSSCGRPHAVEHPASIQSGWRLGLAPASPEPTKKRPRIAGASRFYVACRPGENVLVRAIRGVTLAPSACRRPFLVQSEKPTASPQRSPETQIDYRSDGLGCRMLLYRNSWPLRTRRS